MTPERHDPEHSHHSAAFDLDSMRLPRLVRSQLHRTRRKTATTSRTLHATDIEERVREALYGKTYYGTRKRVFTELFGGRR